MAEVVVSDSSLIPRWDLLPDLAMLNIFKYFNVLQMKQVRMVSKRWEEVIQSQFEDKAKLFLEKCIIDRRCPPWSVFQNSKLKFKNVQLYSEHVTNYKNNEFWMEIGQNVEEFNLQNEKFGFALFFQQFRKNDNKSQILMNLPKLKRLECKWLDLLNFDLPESIEEIKVHNVPKFLPLNNSDEFERFKEIAKMKNLKVFVAEVDGWCIETQRDISVLSDEELGHFRLIKVPFNDSTKYHSFNMLETRELDYSHVHSVELNMWSDDKEALLPQFSNLQKLKLGFFPEECFFFHDHVPLETVKSIQISYDVDDNFDSYDPEAFMNHCFSEDSDAAEQKSSESEDEEKFDMNKYLRRACRERIELFRSSNDTQSSDSDDSNDAQMPDSSDWCNECVENLINCCPNITELKFHNCFSGKIFHHFAKNLTKFECTGKDYTLENFSFKNLGNLEELTLHYKSPNCRRFKINNFPFMPKMKKLSLNLCNFNRQSLEVILDKCPDVKVAKFKRLSVEEILMIEQKWPDLKELHIDDKKLCYIEIIRKLVDGLSGKFTSLRYINTFVLANIKQKDVLAFAALFEKIPTLRHTQWFDYPYYCSVKYLKN